MLMLQYIQVFLKYTSLPYIVPSTRLTNECTEQYPRANLLESG